MSRIYLLCLVLLFGCYSTSSETKIKDLPNILFLFADDYTFDAIHALGNQVVETPNLDRLVRNGTHFSQVFNMGGWNGAVCIASRSMIITGQTIWNAKALTDEWSRGKRQNQTSLSWGKLLEQKGYQTYMTGKWHVSIDPKKVFQTV